MCGKKTRDGEHGGERKKHGVREGENRKYGERKVKAGKRKQLG